MIERGDPLWEDSRVPRLCQVWSRQTRLWIMMPLHNQKKIDCKDMRNELKTYHNKTDWANSVQMQGSWLLFGVGQYFTTEDTEEFSQFTDSVACREYTLPRDKDTYEPKGWIRGNSKIGPVLEITTCCLQGKYGVEISIQSVNKDNSHSWVRISHGLNKLVTNLNNKDQDDNEQETSEMQFEENALKLNAGDFASRSKATTKNVLLPAHPQELFLLERELGLMLNQKNIRSPIIQCRRNWSIFFVMEVYLETMMGRLNSGI